MTLAEILLKRDPTMTSAQAKEAEQVLLRYFEILHNINQKGKNYDKTEQ